MIKRWIHGLLLRILSGSFKVDYKQIDQKALEDWAFSSFDNKGWRSYFATEDLKILREMSFGKGPWDYPVLVGRRMQLMFLFDEMRKSVENKKSREEKKQSQKEGNK